METDRKREMSVLKWCSFSGGGAHIRDVHIYTGEIFVLKKGSIIRKMSVLERMSDVPIKEISMLERCPY